MIVITQMLMIAVVQIMSISTLLLGSKKRVISPKENLIFLSEHLWGITECKCTSAKCCAFGIDLSRSLIVDSIVLALVLPLLPVLTSPSPIQDLDRSFSPSPRSDESEFLFLF